MRRDDVHPRRWRAISARAGLLVVVAAALAAACNSLLAIKDPSLEDAGGGGDDAAIDAAIDSSIDGAIDAPIDSAIDGPPPNLWVFVTNAVRQGNFGVNAPGARRTADIVCEDMYNANFTRRGCTVANVHAVIQIDDTDDTLARMKDKFSIPPTSEVFRATDGMRVTDKWDTLVGVSGILDMPISVGTELRFWSGRGLSQNRQCRDVGSAGWTSLTASGGDTGDTTKVNRWTSTGVSTCDSTAPFLCVCW